MPRTLSGKDLDHVVDNLCDTVGDVGTGHGDGSDFKRLHPSPAAIIFPLFFSYPDDEGLLQQ